MLSLEPFKKRSSSASAGPLPPTCAIPAYKNGAPLHARGLWSSVALGTLLVSFVMAWPFSVDDAFILGRYARRLSNGQGYTFTDGPPTDGVTGPLWLLPLWLGASFGLPPLWVGKVVGGLAAATSVGRIVARARARAGGRLVSPLTCALCVSSVPLAIWPVAGLETGLATLFATELALAVTRSRAPRVGYAGVCAAALAWLRPELALYVFVLLCALTARVGPRALAAWSVASVGALSVLGFRRLMFDHWLPLSSAAKPPNLRHGFEYLTDALWQPGPLLAACALVLAWSTKAQRMPWISRVLGVSLGAHLLSVLVAGGDWMPGYRLLCPVVPLFAWWLAQSFGVLWRRRRPLFWVLASSLLVLRAASLVQEVAVARAAGLTRQAALPKLREAFREQRGLVAAVDVGLLGEAYPGPILDLAGLTEPYVAHAQGGHLDKRISSAWLESRNVATFMLHSAEPVRVDAQGHVRWFRGFPVERRILSMPWVIMNYRVLQLVSYHDAYHYVLLTKRAEAP